MNMNFKRKLPIPKEIKELYPLSESGVKAKAANDLEIKNTLTGHSDKFLLIIGPCSADREDAVMDYIERLRGVQEKVSDCIKIIPRIYTNKPRSTGAGYMGMLHQPDPSEKPDLLKGIISIRTLHCKVINETGFSCADEMLYPENHRFLSDLLSYVAVGARSVEDQQHRLTASGLSIPVGMKNPTGGDSTVLLNSIRAAQTPHMFIYRNWEVESEGNPLAHCILRGFTDDRHVTHDNYRYDSLLHFTRQYAESGLLNPAIIVDCNHSNSDKKPLEQPGIAMDVLHSMTLDAEIRRIVKGLMIESYIEDGRQDEGGTTYGQSITDPCLGWEKSERLIYDIAERLHR